MFNQFGGLPQQQLNDPSGFGGPRVPMNAGNVGGTINGQINAWAMQNPIGQMPQQPMNGLPQPNASFQSPMGLPHQQPNAPQMGNIGGGMGWNPQQAQAPQMGMGPMGNPGMAHPMGGAPNPWAMQNPVGTPMQPQQPQQPQQSMLGGGAQFNQQQRPMGAAQQFRQQNPGQNLYGAGGVHGKAWGTPHQGQSY